MPEVELDPDIVLLIFLPPLLYSAAFFSNLRELRNNLRPIGLLAIGLVVVTMLAVAGVGHTVIGLGWREAFVLGAVVSPTDAVAPAAILRRLGMPRRVVTVVEGESLTNDWTALVLYRFAVAAVVTGSFSLVEAGARVPLERRRRASAIGVAVGDRHRGGPAAAGRPAHRDHDLAADRLRGLPPGRGAGRLRRACGGHGRGVARLAGLRADHRHHPHRADRDLAEPAVPPQRGPVRAHRPAACRWCWMPSRTAPPRS